MLRQLRPHGAFKKSTSRLAQAAWGASRTYSVKAEAASATKIQNIDPTKLSIVRTKTPKELLPHNELVFGRTFTGMSTTQLSLCEQVPNSYRSYARPRMDSSRRLAPSRNPPIPEPLTRSRQLCLPLCI